MKKIRVIVSVTNDLSSDQRVHKVCNTLTELGYEVLLIGRQLKNSAAINDRNYLTKRMKLFFTKGVLFYIEYQIRLLLFLLSSKFDVVHSNDLDTLLPNFLAYKIKRKEIVYDTHEYYTEVPELANSPIKKRIWELVEKFIFPKLKYVFTVNTSIAEIYSKKYEVAVKVIRNVPTKNYNSTNHDKIIKPPILKFDKYIILQGAGINIDRGAEELVKAMKYVENANLLIVGDGDVVSSLKAYVQNNGLSEKVIFITKQPYTILMQYTKHAAVGVTLDKDTNLNYRYSLPNKIFDYIRAEIPILASPLIETKRIFELAEIGCLINNHHPKEIANKLNFMLGNEAPIEIWKDNLKQISLDTNWENESKPLVAVYQEITNKINSSN